MMTNFSHIQEPFRKAITESVHCCVDRFGNALQSFYLSGSIASGEAWPGASDADCFLFVQEEPQAKDLTWCKNKGDELEKQYPVIKGFHLNLFPTTHLHKQADWRFILRYNATCLHGIDIITTLEQEGIHTAQPSKELAKSRIGWMKNNIEGALRDALPKALFPNLPDNPFLITRKLARNFILLEGAYLLMADNAFFGFRQNDVIPTLKTRYPQWESTFQLTIKTLTDPIQTAIHPKDFIAEIAPFCFWSINKIEHASSKTI